MLKRLLGIEGNVLLIGAGGGGDIAGAMHTGFLLEYDNIKYILCALVWERLSIDPNPGPVPLNAFHNCRRISSLLIEVNENTYVKRGESLFTPQIVNVLRALRELKVDTRGIVFDPYAPLGDVAKELERFCKENNIDTVIIVDSGGDILTNGTEETVLSPLADTFTLCLGRELANAGLKVVVGVYGPGCDGEIPRDELIHRFSVLAASRHFLTFIGMTPDIADKMEHVLRHVHTEASRLPLRAYRGEEGVVKIRRGERSVKLDILCAGTYYITIEGACQINTLTRYIDRSHTIVLARQALNSHGVVTELDIEEAIVKEGLLGKLDAETFISLVERLRKKIRKIYS